MINIDDRLLGKVDSNELYLLCHLAKRLNNDRVCWPSNKLLCNETGWHIDKVQRIKKQLVDKGILKVIVRKDDGGSQMSNAYKVNTALIGIFVNLSDLPPLSENTDPPEKSIPAPPVQNTGNPLPQNPVTEVLTNLEVLTNNEAAASGELFSDPKPVKSKQVKSKPQADPLYKIFIDVWNDSFPRLLDFPRDSRHVKSLIKKTNDYLVAEGRVPTQETATDFFKAVVLWSKNKNHWASGKSLGVFDSKYLEVLYEIKHGKEKGGYVNQNSSERFSEFASRR
jgi:hypothetical protein